MCIDINLDIHVALLQISAIPLGSGLPWLAMLVFNYPIRGIMPIINRSQVNSDNNDEYHEALSKDKQRRIRTMILSEIMLLFVRVYCSSSVRRWWTMNPCHSSREGTS